MVGHDIDWPSPIPELVNSICRIAVLLLVMLLPTHLAGAQTPPHVVKNAVLQLVTGDDGKDDTDVFTVSVANADGELLERVYDTKEEIKPLTTFNLWLNRIRAVPAEQVKDSKITFGISPKWDEHWVIKDARLTVNYESGPAERWHWGPFVLQVKGANPMSLDFTLDDSHRM
ncbi:MAG: hypothetical protein WA864_03770 [Acetobacteraceae bacterium]